MALERPSSSPGELSDLESSGDDSVEPELDEVGSRDRRGSGRPGANGQDWRGVLDPGSLTLYESIMSALLY